MKTRFANLLIFIISFGIFSCEKEYVKPVKITYEQQDINSSLPANKEIEDFIAPYKKQIESEMETVLSYAPKSMFKTDGEYNTALGNLMADAVFEKAGPVFEQRHQLKLDAVLLNYGGIRSGISEGEISVRTAFDLMPFENQVVVVELPYDAAQDMIKYLINQKKAHPISGMSLKLNHDYSLLNAEINGAEIKLSDNKNESFFIATSDYLFQGGDNMEFFNKHKNAYFLDYKIRNLLIDYFDEKEEIVSSRDDRFTVANSL